jgi:hypothetical protein
MILAMDEKLQLLLSYAARGWRIFPCLPHLKAPATPDGFKSATTDISQIESWHRNNPFYNWAIATDENLLVIDLDEKDEGCVVWEKLIEENGMPEPTIIVNTGGGGQHWWFKYPSGHDIGRNIRWKPGIDVLGKGGYVIAPPSVTDSEYSFANDAEELAELPTWLFSQLKESSETTAKSGESLIHKEIVEEGKRNDFLAKQAGVYRAKGIGVDEIAVLLRHINHNYCVPPLHESEVDQVARSIGKKAKGGTVSIASRLVAYANAAGLELFKSPEGVAFAKIRVDNHFEVWSVRSSGLNNWLSYLFYQEEGRSAYREALASAKSVLEGQALFDGPTYQVFTRVGKHNGKIFLDMADDRWRAIEIGSDGWRIINDPPVMFLRGAGMLPLEEPSGEAYLDDILRPFINIGDDTNWAILASWLLMSVHPDGPYPVLVLHGEQGSSKST